MELNARELELIRSGLCAKSIKILQRAMDTEREEKEKGLNNEGSKMYYDVRDEIKSVIAKIDGLQ